MLIWDRKQEAEAEDREGVEEEEEEEFYIAIKRVRNKIIGEFSGVHSCVLEITTHRAINTHTYTQAAAMVFE